MKKNLFVLDIDNTLTKSESQHQTAFVQTMQHFGITKVDQNWKGYTHLTDSHILKENFEQNFDETFSLDFIVEFENHMTKIISTLNPVTEITAAMKALNYMLNETNFAICFATGSFLKPALLKLQQAEIKYNPELVVGSNGLYSREEIVEAAMNRAKKIHSVSKFEHIISIGDGIWDFETAQNLGIHFIGIGDQNKDEFKKRNVPLHLDNWINFNVSSISKELEITLI